MNVSDNNRRFHFSCVNCLNKWKLSTKVIQEYVLCDGFLNYTKWTWYDELINMSNVIESQIKVKEVDLNIGD